LGTHRMFDGLIKFSYRVLERRFPKLGAA
jgi:hypothetical protein